jgi:hypothetical protein
MNALKHALFADRKNLPGEDPRQTLELIMQVREEHQPKGPMEDALVNYIISILQELRRLDRAFNVHRTALINQQAVTRERQLAREMHEAYRDADQKIWQVDENNPIVIPRDLDGALDLTISDEHEITVTAHVDRRRRQLMQDYDDALARLENLQARRQPEMMVLPRTSNQIEAPQHLTLRLSNNSSDKNVAAAKNAQDIS